MAGHRPRIAAVTFGWSRHLCAQSRASQGQKIQEFSGQRSVRLRTRYREARPTAHTTAFAAFVRIVGRGTRPSHSRFSGCMRWTLHLAAVRSLTATLRQNHLEWGVRYHADDASRSICLESLYHSPWHERGTLLQFSNDFSIATNSTFPVAMPLHFPTVARPLGATPLSPIL